MTDYRKFKVPPPMRLAESAAGMTGYRKLAVSLPVQVAESAAGMTGYRKLAVSLPVQAAESARRAVEGGRAASVSAYIADAIEEKSKLDDLAALLDEMLAASGGPLTAAERRAADRELGVPVRKPSPARRSRR